VANDIVINNMDHVLTFSLANSHYL